MKAQRPYPQITITPKGEAALVGGHPWVYEGEVTGLSDPVSDGQLVDVISRRGSWLGCGFFNSRSRIRVRVLSRNPNDRFDRAFWRRRIQYAWDYRKTVMGPEDSRCCRMIFGEADGFPGLTVDRFESVLVAQVLCLGMELIKEELFSLLLEVLRSDGQDVVGVYERNDVAIRELEGMEQGKGWHPVDGEKAPDFTAVDIEENGIRYTVDFENGQKTGFFLDQKYNRQAVAKLAIERKTGARGLRSIMEDVLGETVVVTNITGNGGALGSEEVKNASPDGYTCLFYHTCLNINQATGIADYGSEAFETVAVVGKSSGEAVVVRTDAMYDELKAAPTAPGFREIMIPGEIEFHLTRQAEREGIDISPAIEQDFADLAARYGVPLELLQSC